MKKLLLSMLLLAGGIASSSATDYKIKVCNVTVTSTNANDVGAAISSSNGTVSGSIKYTPSNNTLTLTNATINAKTKYAIEINGESGLKIKIVGKCYIYGGNVSEGYAIRMTAENLTTTIIGEGATNYKSDNTTGSAHSGEDAQLYLAGKQGGLHCHKKCDLTLQDIYIASLGEKFGIDGANGSSSEKLILKGDIHVYAKCTGSNSDRQAMGDLASISIPSGYNYYIPGGGYLSTDGDHCVKKADGGVAYTVEILKEVKYGLYVSGYDLSNCNYDVIGTLLKKNSMITSDASSVEYYPSSKKLLLNGVAYKYTSSRFLQNNDVDNLIVSVKGTSNTIDNGTGWGAIYSKKAMSIQGDGEYTGCSLSITQSYWGISAPTLTLKNLTASITGKQYAISDCALTIDKCKITAKATESGSDYAAIKNISSATLTNVDVKSSYCCYRPSLKGFGNATSLYPTVEMDVPTTTYNIKVLGHQITNVNPNKFGVVGYSSESGGGISWENSSKTLIVKATKLSSTTSGLRGIELGIANATIELSGTNTIETAAEGIYLNNQGISMTSLDNTITNIKSSASSAVANGAGTLTVNVAGNLYLNGAEYGYRGGTASALLELKKKANNTWYSLEGGSGCIGNTELKLTNVDFTYVNAADVPGLYYYNKAIRRPGGYIVKNNSVVISAITKIYDLEVAGVPVTNCNMKAIGSRFITSSGTGIYASFDGDKTLTLNGCEIDMAGENKNCIYNKGISGLNIVSNATLTSNNSSWTCLNIWGNTTITGSSLILKGTYGGINVANNAKLTLRDIYMTATKDFKSVDETGSLEVDLKTKNLKIKVDGSVYNFANFNLLNGTKAWDGNDRVCYWSSSKKYLAYDNNGTDVKATHITFTDKTATTDIDAIEVANDNEVQQIYDATGRESSTAKRGLNIIRMSDGTIRKVMVK